MTQNSSCQVHKTSFEQMVSLLSLSLSLIPPPTLLPPSPTFLPLSSLSPLPPPLPLSFLSPLSPPSLLPPSPPPSRLSRPLRQGLSHLQGQETWQVEDKGQEKHARPGFQRVIPVPDSGTQPEGSDGADSRHGLRPLQSQ